MYIAIFICFLFLSRIEHNIKNANQIIERVQPPAVCTLKSLFNLIA